MIDKSHIIQLNDFVCAAIPFDGRVADLHDEPQERLRKYVTSLSYSEGCLGHTHMLNRLLLAEGLEPYAFHYGSEVKGYRHVVSLAGECLFDPMFGRHALNDGRGDWVYGSAIKRVLIDEGWRLMPASDFYEYFESRFCKGVNLKEIIEDYFIVKAYVPEGR